MKNIKVGEDRAMAVLRIQKRNDFKEIIKSKEYPVRKRESSLYRRGMTKGLKKKVGVAQELIAQHLEADYKGYFKHESKTL